MTTRHYRSFRLLIALLFSVGAARLVSAQAPAPRTSRVIVTVLDPSGAVVENASVTVVGLEASTRSGALPVAKTGTAGVATVEGLVPGRYSIQAEFPGFDFGLVRDIQLRAGDNRRAIVLPFKGVKESVTVGQGQDTASSRQSSAFGLNLTNEQIEALSDDLTELQRQLTELGGADAIIRVDSFEGQQLPPKSQIKSIHVTRDQFAAETEQPGATFVDVITQAGVGPIRGSANLSFRDGRMNGRNPFLVAGTKTPEQFRGYGFNIAGTLVDQKADFSLAINGGDNYSQPLLNANKITGDPARILAERTSNDYASINAVFNYALTKDQTLRFGYTQQNNWFTGGFGGFDDLERGYTYNGSMYGFRVMEAGPLGRRTFINTRLSINWSNDVAKSNVERPTIIVLDTATTGGAQIAGGTHSRNFTLESDVDHVRGIHSWRAGIKVVGGTYGTDQRTNYLGTFTFSGADDYLAGKPAQFTIETGDPSFSYFNAQGAIYLQDDIRVSKALTLSPGVRYSAQTRIHDPGAFEPRFGITWAPFTSGRTTIRASAGTFHGWLNTYVLAQAIRLDGTHQRQLIINNPSYPDPGTEGIVPPVSKYQIGTYQLNENVRYSAGVDQALSPKFRFSVIYSYWHMQQLPRGEQLNPLVGGVRPDPNFANIVATVTDAEIRRHDVNATFNLNLAAGNPGANTGRFNWRRLTANGSYAFLNPWRSGVGPFDVPPSGTLETEWGRGPANIRYGVNVGVTSTQLRNVTVNVNFGAIDGQVFHQTTGRDDNQDGFLNDRPAGVGLWSLRANGRETLSARIAYAFDLKGAADGSAARYRASAFMNINNVTNHVNYAVPSGVMTSSNYLIPTNVINPRTVNFGVNVNF